jgi:hypothetical protein
MVVIMAKKVTGTGTIRSDGSVGDAGATGATGAAGSDGTAGTAGNAGVKGNDDLAVLLDSYYSGGYPAGSYATGATTQVCETVPQQWWWVDLSVPVFLGGSDPDSMVGHTYGETLGSTTSTSGIVAGTTTNEVPGNYFAFNTSEVLSSGRVVAQCEDIPVIAYYPGQAATLTEVWQDNQSSSYYGGAAGAAGVAGAKGLGGTGGAGGTGDTGTTGGEGSVFLITDSDDVPAGMMVGTYKTTIVNA